MSGTWQHAGKIFNLYEQVACLIFGQVFDGFQFVLYLRQNALQTSWAWWVSQPGGISSN